MFIQQIIKNFDLFSEKNAFCIDDEFYSYNDLQCKTSGILIKLKEEGISFGEFVIVEIHNDIETYASILALWSIGAVFIPINEKHPESRNKKIHDQIKPKSILSSVDKTGAIITKGLQSELPIKINEAIHLESLLYILFTSGSTGVPKGVKISYGNLTSFITNFLASGYDLSDRDRFLQIYDLTFDASMHTWVLPLFLGAAIYTVDPDKPKYLQFYKLSDQYNITFVKFPPSLLNYLKPYFPKINLPSIRYCLFGGEALNFQLVKDWSSCVPNAHIYNVYGPTEATVNTHHFKIDLQSIQEYKINKGYVSIGKPLEKNHAIIIDENNLEVKQGETGELCLAGDQICLGYFSNTEKNHHSFIEIKHKEISLRYYKTGDSVYVDQDGDYMFLGRIDDQFQINGFRVEPGEIESSAYTYGLKNNCIALAYKDKKGNNEIYLFTESSKDRVPGLKEFLKEQLPPYMIPKEIIDLDVFPKTAGGKIDRAYFVKFLQERNKTI